IVGEDDEAPAKPSSDKQDDTARAEGPAAQADKSEAQQKAKEAATPAKAESGTAQLSSDAKPAKDPKLPDGTNMRTVTVREALRDAMAEEMRRDGRVFVMGEEVAEYQGAYKVTQGLLEEFG